jgi:hypothetical protein
MHVNWKRWLAVCGFAGLVAAPMVQAEYVPWTNVGAVGTPDETDGQKVAFGNDGSVTIRSTIASTSAKLRYNVVSTGTIDEATATEPLSLFVNMKDNGPSTHVVVTLKRVRTSDGRVDTLAIGDSDRLEPSDYMGPTYVLKDPQTGQVLYSLDFRSYAYVVEVQLIKNAADGNPTVRLLQLLYDN